LQQSSRFQHQHSRVNEEKSGSLKIVSICAYLRVRVLFEYSESAATLRHLAVTGLSNDRKGCCREIGLIVDGARAQVWFWVEVLPFDA
jgi:hypothetical protein